MVAADQHLTTAHLYLAVLNDDLAAHDKATEQQQMIDGLLHSKYTNQELYEWMIGQTKVVYRSAYQLALGAAMKAERCFRHEIGNSASPPFIRYDYFDDSSFRFLSYVNINNCLREIGRKNILVEHVPIRDMMVDGSTKALPMQKFNEFPRQIGLADMSSNSGLIS